MALYTTYGPRLMLFWLKSGSKQHDSLVSGHKMLQFWTNNIQLPFQDSRICSFWTDLLHLTEVYERLSKKHLESIQKDLVKQSKYILSVHNKFPKNKNVERCIYMSVSLMNVAVPFIAGLSDACSLDSSFQNHAIAIMKECSAK